MAVRPILLHPDPRLKKRCAPVGAPTDAVRRLIDDMFDTMYDAPGVGLAAPQIGVDARVIVMDCAEKDAEPDPLALVDPEIRWRAETLREHEEGCLSIPEIFGMVSRPEAVRVRYLDRDGAPAERDFEGLWATCVQHEVDHLDGRLFIDYLGPARRMLITEKMKKLKRERAKAAASA